MWVLSVEPAHLLAGGLLDCGLDQLLQRCRRQLRTTPSLPSSASLTDHALHPSRLFAAFYAFIDPRSF
jgi:hypothetical protein